MGKAIKIVIEPKNTSRKMCSQRKIIQDECEECLSEMNGIIHDIASKGMEELKEKISQDMRVFLKEAELKIKESLEHSKEEIKESLELTKKEVSESVASSKEKTDQLSSNSKWILSIVLGVTFCVGAGFGVLWGKVYNKAERSEVLTLKEAKALHDIRDAYYKGIFVLRPDAKIDSTNYNYLIKSIFGGTLRRE